MQQDYAYEAEPDVGIVGIANGEFGGSYTSGNVQLAGGTEEQIALPGSMTLVFMGASSVCGTAIDDGHGGITGTYSVAPIAAVDRAMTGTVDYITGRWTLDLEAGGFFEGTDLFIDYAWCPLEILAGPGGSAGTTNSPPYSSGSVVQVSATASNHWAFFAWTGSRVPVGQETNETISVTLGEPAILRANFKPILTSRGTPLWWLSSFGWTSFEAADVADQDGDGLLTWEEWELGTDPTKRDTDGDGLGDRFERDDWKTDPTSSSSPIVVDGFTVETTTSFGMENGIVCAGGSPRIRNCRITDCGLYGVVCANGIRPVLENLTIHGNGGGIACVGTASPRIVNCAISDNSTTNDGGGLYIGAGSTATVVNCTIAYNDASGSGGGVASGGSPTLRNTIIWGNTASAGDSIHVLAGTVDADYCDIEDGWPGANMDADPQFLGPSNFHLSGASPCIDSGTSSNAPGRDLDGISRPLDGDNDGMNAFDMGAYEFVHPSADSDRDRLKDVSELIAGTDPTNSLNYFRILSRNLLGPDGPIVVSWESAIGRLYSVSSSSNLAAGVWDYCPNATGLPGTGWRMVYTNDCGPGGPRYYRLGVRLAD